MEGLIKPTTKTLINYSTLIKETQGQAQKGSSKD